MSEPRYADIEEYVFKYNPKVSSLIITWDLYWSMAEDDNFLREAEFNNVNDQLTAAAIQALESGDRSIWYAASEKFGKYGAADTEPRWQFEYLWRRTYGEDE